MTGLIYAAGRRSKRPRRALLALALLVRIKAPLSGKRLSLQVTTPAEAKAVVRLIRIK